ncbi:MAG TPA: VOC family protein [Methylomirabilota bacterium]|nr:VOC family protein [Methylomirabilota bacterium]
MASVSQLGYVGVGTSDAKAWQDLATNVLGMQVVPGDDRSTTYLRMDQCHHRVELRADGRDDLAFVGWEVPDRATLDRVAQQLEDGGVRVTAGTRDEADGRRVIDLVKCVDPNGVATEIFCGRPVNPQPFQPTRPMTGFKTGDMGLGHILVYARNRDDTVRFYRDLLGFRVSDFTEVRTPGGTARLAFLHCNPRHHSIAILEAPGAPKRINHVMFECNSLDDVGSGRDLCLRRGVPIAIDLGRHMNDHMVSFYLANPSGFALEYGWGARMIDDATWQVEHYDTADSLWGHPQLRELISKAAPGAQ